MDGLLAGSMVGRSVVLLDERGTGQPDGLLARLLNTKVNG